MGSVLGVEPSQDSLPPPLPLPCSRVPSLKKKFVITLAAHILKIFLNSFSDYTLPLYVNFRVTLSLYIKKNLAGIFIIVHTIYRLVLVELISLLCRVFIPLVWYISSFYQVLDFCHWHFMVFRKMILYIFCQIHP